MMHKTRMAALIACLLFTRITGHESAAIALISQHAIPANSFRFEYRSGNAALPESICSGTFLSPQSALTAAHCLKGKEKSLNVFYQNLRQARHVESIAFHPTHDIAIIHFSPADDPCSSHLAPIQIEVTESGRYYAWKFPFDPVSGNASGLPIRKAFQHLSDQDSFVLHFHDPDSCLGAGDSGSGLFVDGEGKTLRLVSLLIGGAPACPGDQTFVRLGALRDWIDSQMAPFRNDGKASHGDPLDDEPD